ncbi:MAG: hypothetical protein HFE49_07865 [Clostridia bacterium]|nr:hypothetical protein [Clostridia bacterium]
MIYTNDDPMAVMAMEEDRTADYGLCEDSHDEACPVCGAECPEFYYMDEDEECIGCSECVYRTEVLF